MNSNHLGRVELTRGLVLGRSSGAMIFARRFNGIRSDEVGPGRRSKRIIYMISVMTKTKISSISRVGKCDFVHVRSWS